MAQCTFKPRRQSERTSERYLAKKGITRTASPEEFMRFHEVRPVALLYPPFRMAF
jgi:hypothetical protein